MFPIFLHLGQTCFFVGQLVAILSRQLEVLLADSLILKLFQMAAQLFLTRNILADGDIHKMSTGAGFVQGINGFVGQAAVGHIPVGESDTGAQRLLRVAHIVMFLVTVLDILKDLNGLLDGRGFNHDLLETTLQGSVLFDALLVFINGRGTDALHFATRQRRFQHISRIHGSGGRAGTDDGVYLVDEEDNLLVRLQLVDDGFQAFLELAAILRASYYGCHVEHYDTLVEE